MNVIDEHVRDCYRCRFRLEDHQGGFAICALNQRSIHVNKEPVKCDEPISPPADCPLRSEPVQINVVLSKHAPEPSE